MSEQFDQSHDDAEQVFDEAEQTTSTEQAEPQEVAPTLNEEPKTEPIRQAAETVVGVAAEAAYAATGFAALVGDKAKEFIDEQTRQYREAHPDEDPSNGKAFMNQMAAHLGKMLDDLAAGFKELADRGRATLKPEPADSQTEPVQEEEPPVG